jgi:hypothetical protein
MIHTEIRKGPPYKKEQKKNHQLYLNFRIKATVTLMFSIKVC